MKSSIFQDIAPCSPLKVNRCCKWTRSRPQSFLPTSCWFLAWLTLQLLRWSRHIPLIWQLPFNRLHSITSPKTELFSDNVNYWNQGSNLGNFPRNWYTATLKLGFYSVEAKCQKPSSFHGIACSLTMLWQLGLPVLTQHNLFSFTQQTLEHYSPQYEHFGRHGSWKRFPLQITFSGSKR
jgi:hypothetical protein